MTVINFTDGYTDRPSRHARGVAAGAQSRSHAHVARPGRRRAEGVVRASGSGTAFVRPCWQRERRMTTPSEPWNRCDVCGRFVALADFDNGAVRRLVYPDSEFSRE